jgi:glycosyltransferase involved in cell wall biosynthesis
MRIAYLINQYPMVSHTFIRREILALERQGFEVIRISLSGWNAKLTDPQDLLERERTFYVAREGWLKVLAAVMGTLLTRPLSMIAVFVTAFRIAFSGDRPPWAHLGYFAEACLLEHWLRRSGARHLHAHFSTNSAEVAMYVHALGGPRWSFTVHGVATLENPKFTKLREKVLDCVFVVGICSFARGQLMRFTDQHSWPKIQVVHCGLEPTDYSAPEGPAPSARRLVCVGRLCHEKAQLLLVQAAQRLVQQGVNFELVLAGDGELRSEIEAMIARYALGARVRITGWLSGEQVRDELQTARALVLPSIAEGLPVVIMEAMALRRPVISTYVAGIPELVIAGEHGWLVPCGDIELLAEAMRDCLDAPEEMLVRMGEAARARVLARHNIDTEAAKLAKLFRDVVSPKSA